MPPTRITPEERQRRQKWLDNCFVATGVYFTPRGTAEQNRDQIHSVDDLRRFPPAKAMERLNLGDFDAYISNEERFPHGEMEEKQLDSGTLVQQLIREPNKHGYPLANWKDDKGRYLCCWLISGDDAGLRQVVDIGSQRKPQMSFAWSTKLVKDGQGRVIDIRIIPKHVAVLGHDGHPPQYDDCKILHLAPLFPQRNQHLPRVREMIKDEKQRQASKVIDDITNGIRRCVDELMERTEAAAAANKEPSAVALYTQVWDKFREELKQQQQQESVPVAEKTVETIQIQTPTPALAPTPTPTPTVADKNINLIEVYHPAVPIEKPFIAPPPLLSSHHFNLPEPSSLSNIAVCASSNSFLSNNNKTSTMDATAPATTPAAGAAPTSAAAGTAPASNPTPVAVPAGSAGVEELKKKVESYLNKYRTGELKQPQFTPEGTLANPEDTQAMMVWSYFLSLKNDLAEKEKEATAKENEHLRKENESFTKLGNTRYNIESFVNQNGLKEAPQWNDDVISKFFNSLSSVPADVRGGLEDGYNMITACSANQWGKKRGRDDDSSSSQPAAKRQAMDPDVVRSISSTMSRVIAPYEGGSSNSASHSSSSGSSPASFEPKYDINSYEENSRVNDSELEYAQNLMKRMIGQ